MRLAFFREPLERRGEGCGPVAAVVEALDQLLEAATVRAQAIGVLEEADEGLQVPSGEGGVVGEAEVAGGLESLVARAHLPPPIAQHIEARSTVDVAQGGEHRGLAGAVKTDEPHGLAGLEDEGDVGENRSVSLVPGGQALNLEEEGRGITDGAHELGGVRSSRPRPRPSEDERASWIKKSAATAMAMTMAEVSPRRKETTATITLSTTTAMRMMRRVRSDNTTASFVADSHGGHHLRAPATRSPFTVGPGQAP